MLNWDTFMPVSSYKLVVTEICPNGAEKLPKRNGAHFAPYPL